jgi:tetratricopeptide (TPR) repeat protein
MRIAGIARRSVFLPSAVLILCLAAGAGWSATSLETAREAIRFGKYDGALKILTSALQENPVDTNAHLGMTEYYLALQNYPEAQLSAERTIVLNPAYATVVGHAYYAAGDRSMKLNQPSRSLALYETALAFAPTLKSQARGKYLAVGNALTAKGSFPTAISAYTQEIGLNPAAKKIIADSVFLKGQSLLGTDDKDADRLFAYSTSLDSSYGPRAAQARTDYGLDLINRAKVASGEERMKLREHALRYLSKEIVDQAVPPPIWKTTLKEEYIGKGLNDEGGVIVTPRFGTQIKPGDRIVVTGREFQFLKDRWETHAGSFETINRSTEEDKMVGIRAPGGEKIVLQVDRPSDE